MTTPRTPTFSIIIEWENARFAELDRTRKMLRALRAQLIELDPPSSPPEVLFLYTRENISGDMVQSVVAEEFRPAGVPAATRIIATDGLRYYEQKNFGARQCGGEIKVLLDCDVVPEPGWLKAILGSFANPDVHVAAGQTYIEHDSLYSRAVALYWFCPLRDPRSGLVPTDVFHANNVAFRAEVFDAYPFPDLPSNRDQCLQLARRLTAAGIGLYTQREARAGHPVPLGVWYFIRKAINDGRDQAVMRDAVERSNLPPFRHVWWNWRKGVAKNFGRFRTQYRDVGLGPLGAAGGFAIAVLWCSLMTVGEILHLLRPSLVPKLFPV
ncbi:MAG: glycosyltransferase [Rhodospirillaceae bacterium]